MGPNHTLIYNIPFASCQLRDICGAEAVVHHVAGGGIPLGLPRHLVHDEGRQLDTNLSTRVSGQPPSGQSQVATSLFISLCSWFLLFSASLISWKCNVDLSVSWSQESGAELETNLRV